MLLFRRGYNGSRLHGFYIYNLNGFSQAYYGLCSLDGWDTEDRFFKLNVFFDKCVGLFTEDPNDPWVIDTLQFLTRYFHLIFLFSSLFITISSRQMPALTRRGKRILPEDNEDNEDDLGNIGTVGILAQRAARREAAQEQEVAQAHEAAQAQTQEPADNQVRMLRLFLIVYIHDAFLKFQDDNVPVRPPTPPHSSPLRQEGRSFSSSTAPQ